MSESPPTRGRDRAPESPPSRLSPERQERRQRRQEAFRLADVSTVGTVFPVAILVGLFGGQAIGGYFGARRAGAVIGLLVGIASGFYNLYTYVKKVTPDDPYEDDVDLSDNGSRGGDADA